MAKPFQVRIPLLASRARPRRIIVSGAIRSFPLHLPKLQMG